MSKFLPYIIGAAVAFAAAVIIVRKTSYLDTVFGLAEGTAKS